MRLFLITLLTLFATTVLSVNAQAADPDGVRQYCQEKLNKRGSYNCDCIVEKYYPKKAELEQAWGVPIQDPDVTAVHIVNACIEVAKTGSHEYDTCMQSPAFKKGKNEFGAERFCRCYADEWENQLSEFQKTPNAVVDSNSKTHLKGMARTICKRKLQ